MLYRGEDNMVKVTAADHWAYHLLAIISILMPMAFTPGLSLSAPVVPPFLRLRHLPLDQGESMCQVWSRLTQPFVCMHAHVHCIRSHLHDVVHY